MLRSDPSLDAQAMPWAADIGILFGREAAKRGVLVLNDPDSLGRAINKLYFQSFPEEVRAETLITRNADDVKAFAKAHGGSVILKPLQGSGGSGVFKLDAKAKSNLNQMIEAIERDGYIIAQAYVPAAKKGDIRFFLMNGRPLQDRRQICRAAPGRRRRTTSAATSMPAAAPRRSRSARPSSRSPRLIRPKLIADGMFLVGIDIVGDKILEVNVFSPGNLQRCSLLAGVDFAVPIIEAIERKLAIARDFAGAFDNRALASL